MASFRIAGLMAPPSIAPLPPFRPSGGAFGPVAADVPASHCAISDRVAAREGFYGCLPGPLLHLYPPRSVPAWRPAPWPLHDDLISGSEAVFLREVGCAVDELCG